MSNSKDLRWLEKPTVPEDEQLKEKAAKVKGSMTWKYEGTETEPRIDWSKTSKSTVATGTTTKEMSELIRADRDTYKTAHVASDTLVIPEDRPSGYSEAFMKNPLVPVGIGATLFALFMGIRSMNTGERWKSQFYMRMRVGAQLGTVVALMAGAVYFTGPRQVADDMKGSFGSPSTWWQRTRAKFSRSE